MTSSLSSLSIPLLDSHSTPRSFGALDTEPEAIFDRIAKLAARLFQAPIAFISLMDSNRQWFVANYGADLTATSQAFAFCAHTMASPQPMFVCDTAQDERFQDNPLVLGEMAVRFCAGAPFRGQDGSAIGSVCVLDTTSRPQPPQHLLDNLADLAFLVMETLEFRSAAAAKRDLNEQELRRSLQEKETLLQEVHHRVKNNLQIVSSLLKLQADSLSDKNAASLLRESQQRVLSMALIHERLYARKHMAAIEFDSYARTLVHELVYSYAGRAGNVTGRILPPQILLSIGQAIPCGLILNELVTNALKYAYPETGKGEVVVELHESPEGRIRLAVSDQGRGLPEAFDFRTAKSLGLRIVDVLAKQLGGTLTVERGPTTKFILDFPREELKNQPAAA